MKNMFDRDNLSREVMLEIIAKVPEITVDPNAPIETIRAECQRALMILEIKKKQNEPRANVTAEGAQDCSKVNGENEQRKPSLCDKIDLAKTQCEKRPEKGRGANRNFTEQERE